MPAPSTSIERIDEDWPFTVTPASVRAQPRPRVAISAKATASSGNQSRIGLR